MSDQTFTFKIQKKDLLPAMYYRWGRSAMSVGQIENIRRTEDTYEVFIKKSRQGLPITFYSKPVVDIYADSDSIATSETMNIWAYYGVPPYTFFVFDNQSGGYIDPLTASEEGEKVTYYAGPDGGTDTIHVLDSRGYIDQLSILVSEPEFATWNPDDKGDRIILSNGNLTATLDTGIIKGNVRCTVGVSSGKWYWEVSVVSLYEYPAYMFTGVGNSDALLDTDLGNDGTPNGWSYSASGRFYHEGVVSYIPNAYGHDDIIGVALDMDNGKIWFSKNGVWQVKDEGEDPNPATGTDEALSGLSGKIYPMVGLGLEEGDQITANFGATDFAYSIPDGFSIL